MPFTLGGIDIERAQLRWSRFGLWSANVRVDGVRADGRELVAGAAADLVIGDLTMRGVVGPGGEYGGDTNHVVTGPAAWLRAVPARAYRDDRGVYLARVVRDLAAELGALVDDASVSAADRAVGYAWERDAGGAAGALEAVAGAQWWVDEAGALHLGARPARPIPASVRVSVERHRADLGWVMLAVDEDKLSSLVPGAVITDPALPAPFTIADLVIHVDAGAVRAEAWSASTAERMRQIANHLQRSARWHGVYRYRVTADFAGKPTLVPFGDVPGLPTIEQIPKAHGMPGATSVLPGDAEGPIVLVAFAGGSPGAPYVVGFLADQPLPLEVRLDARDRVKLGAGTALVAKAGATDIALGQCRAAILALGGTLPPLGSVAAEKVWVE